MDLKRTFLIASLVALVAGGAIGISALLTGRLGDVQQRLLLTALALGGFSLTGWASMMRRPGWWAWPLQPLGIASSVVGLVAVTLSIWNVIGWDHGVRQLSATLAILAFSFGHLSVLTAFQPSSIPLGGCWLAGIAALLVVAYMLLYGVWGPIHPDLMDTYQRLLGISIILDVLASLALLPLTRLARAKGKSSAGKRSASGGKLRAARQR